MEKSEGSNMSSHLNQTCGRAERLIHGASRVLNSTSAVIAFFMMLFVAADVIGRYFFNMPFEGSTDLVELMMGLVVFFGMAYCAQQDGHTRVDVVYERLPRRVQVWLDIGTFTASLFIFSMITWQLAARAWRFLLNPATASVTDLLHIPHVYFLFLVALGSAVLCLELLVHIIHSLTCIR
jgi:TRAP-type C4-dicarboxylate transport system permease small subunit